MPSKSLNMLIGSHENQITTTLVKPLAGQRRPARGAAAVLLGARGRGWLDLSGARPGWGGIRLGAAQMPAMRHGAMGLEDGWQGLARLGGARPGWRGARLGSARMWTARHDNMGFRTVSSGGMGGAWRGAEAAGVLTESFIASAMRRRPTSPS